MFLCKKVNRQFQNIVCVTLESAFDIKFLWELLEAIQSSILLHEAGF